MGKIIALEQKLWVHGPIGRLMSKVPYVFGLFAFYYSTDLY